MQGSVVKWPMQGMAAYNVTNLAKTFGKCLDTLAIVPAESSAQVQVVVHDACVNHACVKGRLHWQAVTWYSTLHNCTIM